ncbi:hypothetical protein [Psychromonas sp.]|uniref:hypothetical protein n=1 Tax=Psychromonas sp. TaxID=1884585 RepID=UPI00356248B8
MKVIFLVAILSVFMLGCASKPVLNVEGIYVPSNMDGTNQSRGTVQKAILTAAAKRGWSPRLVQPGLIEASISVRTHSATVEIPFSEGAYSINYKKSENLDYNGSSIHRNYNNWVIKLSRSIQSELGVNSQKY